MDLEEYRKDLLEDLNPLNIEARYPNIKAKIGEHLNNDNCKAFLEETEDLLCWIKKQL